MAGGSIIVPKDNSSDLLVNVQSLVVSNSLQGTISFPDDTKNLTMAIDSATSQMWLPRNICDRLEDAFGLTFDPNTELYLINTTAHSQLLNLNPEVTFTLAANYSSSSTTVIALPYAALDLAVGVPFYNSTSTIRYFPIRRAANATQYTLGRVLLQEAYLIVDYERSNFTVGQTSHSSEREIVPILPPQPDAEHRFGSGVIAGIVVGLVAFIAALSILVWFLRRRRCKRTKSQVHELAAKEKEEKSTFDDTLKTVDMPYKHMGTELMSESVHELHEEQMKHQLMSNPVHELPGVVDIEHELPADGTAFAQK